MEIERKWLVSAVPDALGEGDPIEQGYLAIEPGLGEARVRRSSKGCRLTAKRGAGLVRGEWEITLSAEQFEAMWPATEGRRVEKVRYRLGPIELDVYEGALAGLIVAEVEFASVEEAAAFEVPGWFGEDVTEDPAYRNQRLAVDGRP